MGYINELSSSSSSLESYKIPDNSNLILLVQTTFFWDQNLKGTDIKLLNSNLTANKSDRESDYQSVLGKKNIFITNLGNLPMSSGRHYWEIKIDKYIDEEDLFIGIARKNIDL